MPINLVAVLGGVIAAAAIHVLLEKPARKTEKPAPKPPKIEENQSDKISLANNVPISDNSPEPDPKETSGDVKGTHESLDD